MTARHPSVIYSNAINTETVRVCYPSEAEAYDFMITYRPFNNTNVTPTWCSLIHCPHGCRAGGTHVRPVLQERIAGPPRWRCPQCKTEYIPGRPPGINPADLAGQLLELGLTRVRVAPYGDMPVTVIGVIPAGNRDAGGWTVRVTESGTAVFGTSPKWMLEPLTLTLIEPMPPGARPFEAERFDKLTIAEVTGKIRGYL